MPAWPPETLGARARHRSCVRRTVCLAVTRMLMARLAKGPFLKRQPARPIPAGRNRPLLANSSPLPLSPPISILSRRPRFVAPTVLTPTASGRFNAAPQFRNPSPSRRGCRRTAAAAAEECRDEVGLEERARASSTRITRSGRRRARRSSTASSSPTTRHLASSHHSVQIHYAPRRRVG